MAGYLERLSRPGLASCVVLTLFAVGVFGPGETDLLYEISDPALPPVAVSEPVTVATVDPETTGTAVVSSAAETPTGGAGPVATVTDPTIGRGVQVQVGPPPTPPPTVVRPAPMPGDCVSWSAEFVARGATVDEIRFFFAGGIIERESGCGRDTLNDHTADTGICQINGVHNRAGWFGGRYFGDGGWLLALHGLRTRVDTDSPEWVDPCLTLYRVCGERPWRPPYGCENNSLEVVL